MTELLDIGEVRRRSGLPASTLHFYERTGLIVGAGRNGLRRQYQPEVVERLAVTVLCRQVGFRLDEIAELLATDGETSWRDLARSKLDEIRGRIRSLERMEAGLGHALNCPSTNVLRCRHFQAELADVLPVTAGAEI